LGLKNRQSWLSLGYSTGKNLFLQKQQKWWHYKEQEELKITTGVKKREKNQNHIYTSM
jgi:hypothetical protein